MRASATLALLLVLGLFVATRSRVDARVEAADAVALLDGFEVEPWPDPGLWQLPSEVGQGMWPSACRARSGRRSLRAFGGAAEGAGAACDAPLPPGTTTAARMTLDLRAASEAHRLDLYFEIWARMPQSAEGGLFLWLLVPQEDGTERVPIFGATGASGDWTYPPRRLDLRNLVDVRDPSIVYDLRGDLWEIDWVARAPEGAPAGHGIYVDDISLVWEPDPIFPSPTPYVPPTATKTLTPRPATATATATKEPTPTPVPTETAAPRLYLPMSYRAWPEPEPTATPGGTLPTPTPTSGGPTVTPATVTATATATEGPIGTATPDSATPTSTPVAWIYLPRADNGAEPDTMPSPMPTSTPMPTQAPEASPQPTP